MESLKRAIDSFKEMLDNFQCPYPNSSDTYRIRDFTDFNWSYKLKGKSCYNFFWTEEGRNYCMYYPLRRGSKEMYVTNTHILLVETCTVKYNVMHYYIVFDRSKEIKREGVTA